MAAYGAREKLARDPVGRQRRPLGKTSLLDPHLTGILEGIDDSPNRGPRDCLAWALATGSLPLAPS